nr:LINE-type retrotransposon LIb DNA [Ipomoea batatas]
MFAGSYGERGARTKKKKMADADQRRHRDGCVNGLARIVGCVKDIIPDTFVDAIRAIPIPLGDQNKDIIGWPKGEAGTNGDIKDWSWLWRLSCREKIKTFLLTTLKGRLLTNS